MCAVREGAKVVMGSIESEIVSSYDRAETTQLFGRRVAHKAQAIFLASRDLKKFEKFLELPLVFQPSLEQIATIKIAREELDTVTRCVHGRPNVSTCKCQ